MPIKKIKAEGKYRNLFLGNFDYPNANHNNTTTFSLLWIMVSLHGIYDDSQLSSNPQQGGPRRRCMDFEMVGSSRNHFEDGSRSSSSTSSQSLGNTYLINKCLKLGNDSPGRLLTGISLHLNAWRFLNHTIHLDSNIQIKGIISVSHCSLCYAAIESQLHVICPISVQVWKYFESMFGVPNSWSGIASNLSNWCNIPKHKYFFVHMKMIVVCILWELWKLRCNDVFNQQTPNVEKCIKNISNCVVSFCLDIFSSNSHDLRSVADHFKGLGIEHL